MNWYKYQVDGYVDGDFHAEGIACAKTCVEATEHIAEDYGEEYINGVYVELIEEGQTIELESIKMAFGLR